MDTIHYRQIIDKVSKHALPTGANVHTFLSKKATIISGLNLADTYFEQGNTEKGLEIIKKVQIEISNFIGMFPVKQTDSQYSNF